jgi:hypothetical protein
MTKDECCTRLLGVPARGGGSSFAIGHPYETTPHRKDSDTDKVFSSVIYQLSSINR